MSTSLRSYRATARNTMVEATMQCDCSFVLTLETYLHSRGWARGFDKVDATVFVDGNGSEGEVGDLVRRDDGFE